MSDSEGKRLAEAYIAGVVASGKAQIINDLKVGLPDLSVAMDEMIEEGGEVVALWHSTGTHTHDLWGIPATGQTVMTRHFTRFGIGNGTVEKAETLTDRMSILAQLRSVGMFAPDFGLAPRKAADAAGAK